jgi:hypothetical protein
VAFVRHPTRGTAGLDVIGGLTGSNTISSPVLFPGNGLTIDLTSFGGEMPTPIETCTSQHPGADYSRAGLPLIAMLTEAPAAGLIASMTDPGGRTVSSDSADVCVVDEATYESSDTVYGPTGKGILAGGNAVLIIPRAPLTNGQYAVTISQPNRSAITWGFTVSAPGPAPAPIERSLSAASISVGDRVWTGRRIMPTPDVSVDGDTLNAGIDYEVAYGANKSIGKGYLTVSAPSTSDFTGERRVEFKILPTATTITRSKAGSRYVKVYWAKVPKVERVSRYQVRYKASGTASWKTTIVPSSHSSRKVTRLKKGNLYDLGVRSYKTVSGKRYYSAWSATVRSAVVK